MLFLLLYRKTEKKANEKEKTTGSFGQFYKNKTEKRGLTALSKEVFWVILYFS